MENKKIDVLFGLVVIAFLIAAIIVIKDVKMMRTNDYKDYLANVTTIVKMKNARLMYLAGRLNALQRENEDLKNTLAETRNSLDALSKKLSAPSQPAVTAPASK